MTQLLTGSRLRFFLTAPTPCPYLPGKFERKVFAHLPFGDGASANDELTQVGFRRSQNIAYRPACDGCDACLSVRVPAAEYVFSRSERRALERNAGLERRLVDPEATHEQFDLLKRYLACRHPDGGMSDMTWADYVAMVEDTPAKTQIAEYRTRSADGGPGDLVACALVDLMSDGLSLVYLFYAPELQRGSPGRFVILDHLRQAQATGQPYVYLGYWVQGSPKMDYKGGYRPLEILTPRGWMRAAD